MIVFDFFFRLYECYGVIGGFDFVYENMCSFVGYVFKVFYWGVLRLGFFFLGVFLGL